MWAVVCHSETVILIWTKILDRCWTASYTHISCLNYEIEILFFPHFYSNTMVIQAIQLRQDTIQAIEACSLAAMWFELLSHHWFINEMLGYSGPVHRLKPVLDNKTAIQWRITTTGTVWLKECLGMQPAVYLIEKCCSASEWTYTRQKMEYDSQRCTGITERRRSRVLQDGAVCLAKVTEWAMISLCPHPSLDFLIQVDYLDSRVHFTGRSLEPRRQSVFITHAWLAHDPTYRPHWLAWYGWCESWWSQGLVKSN